MTPQEALTIINQALRAVNTNADNHDLFKEAAQTLAKVVNQVSQDGTKLDEIPAEEFTT